MKKRTIVLLCVASLANAYNAKLSIPLKSNVSNFGLDDQVELKAMKHEMRAVVHEALEKIKEIAQNHAPLIKRVGLFEDEQHTIEVKLKVRFSE